MCGVEDAVERFVVRIAEGAASVPDRRLPVSWMIRRLRGGGDGELLACGEW